MGFGCIRVMNCPEWECVGVLPVRVGRLARSFLGDLRHNSGSDRRPEPRLAAQPGMRRTRSCPPMRPGAQPRPPVWRYPSEMALPTWARPKTALVPPHSVTGRCPSIRHWHSAAASRSLGPVTVRPRPRASGAVDSVPFDDRDRVTLLPGDRPASCRVLCRRTRGQTRNRTSLLSDDRATVDHSVSEIWNLQGPPGWKDRRW